MSDPIFRWVDGRTPLTAANLNQLYTRAEARREIGDPTAFAPATVGDAEMAGLLGWAFDPVSCSGGAARPSGVLTGSRVHLLKNSTVTNLVLVVSAAGSALTSGRCFAVLYSTAGMVLGVTADQSAAWATAGSKSMALAGGPVALTAGYYDVAWWSVGTTPPQMLKSVDTVSINLNLAAASLRFWTANTALTTTAPTRTTKTASSNAFWAGVS
jgi:hypothetical protein